ncbi:MAG: hypothetical protein KAU95_02100 [Candidatus Aenigmarchaeota archaeon]|nr:hypothetical protein [Candidatus Aenigmarchaeota archaeon]
MVTMGDGMAGGKSVEDYANEFIHLSGLSERLSYVDLIRYPTGSAVPQPPELFFAKSCDKDLNDCETKLKTTYKNIDGPLLKGQREYTSQFTLEGDDKYELTIKQEDNMDASSVDKLLYKISQHLKNIPELEYGDIKTVETEVVLKNPKYGEMQVLSEFECDSKMIVEFGDDKVISISNPYKGIVQFAGANPGTGMPMYNVMLSTEDGLQVEQKPEDSVNIGAAEGSTASYAQIFVNQLTTPKVLTEKPSLKVNGKSISMKEYFGNMFGEYVKTNYKELEKEITDIVANVDDSNPIYAGLLIGAKQMQSEMEGLGEVYDEYNTLFEPVTKEVMERAYKKVQEEGQQMIQNMLQSGSEGASKSEDVHGTVGTI